MRRFFFLFALLAFATAAFGTPPRHKIKNFLDLAEPQGGQVVSVSRWTVNDFSCIPNPGNPPTGLVRLYCDSGTGNLTCLTSAGAACLSGGGGSGTVTSVATTSPLSGGTITTTGTLSCPTCVTSAAALTSNAVIIGGGGQASSAISADTTTTHALFATAGAPAFRALATGDLPTGIPIGNVGSSGLSGTAPVTISAAGAIGCATCVTSAASLTSTAIVTGAGSQASQTPSATATLTASGNMSLPGTLGVTGHVTLEGVTSTGATGTGNLVFATSPTFTTPALGTPSSATLTNATGLPINGVVSATGAITTIADGNNPLVINCALTSGTTCLTTGETAAATTAGAAELQVSTLTTSTAIGVQITQGANGPANAAAPNLLNVTAAAAGGLAGASNNGSTGAGISISTGNGSAGGATTGNGGSGGSETITYGSGGAGGGTTTNNGGNGGGFAGTTGNGGNAAATGISGNGGNFSVTLGVGGTTGTTPGSNGQFSVTSTAPASVSGTAGIPVGTLFNVAGVAGGATSNAAGTAGVGSIVSLSAGAGGAGTGTNAVGGAGGAVNLTAGNGGASAGTGVNSNGGNVVVTPGTAGTGGSGTAGLAGVLSVAGTNAGFVGLTQGSANTTANTRIPANTIIDQAPAAVTAYAVTRPGAASSGLMQNVNASSVITQSFSGDANHAVSQLSKTALLTTFTVCAATAGTACGQAGQYRITYNFWGSGTACSSVTAGSVTLNLTWTDENAVAHTTINPPIWDQKTSAVTAGTMNFNTALGTEGAGGSYIISTNGTVIQAATTYTACTTGTGTYNLRIGAEQLE